MTQSNVEAAFHQAMLDGYQDLAKLGYRPTYFMQMVQEYGGVETARRLLRQPNIADGLTKLWEMGRLDLSVEAFVLRPEYKVLFTDEERALARQHLADLNYTAPWDGPEAAGPSSAAPSGTPSLVERLARAVSNTQGGAMPPDGGDPAGGGNREQSGEVLFSRAAVAPLIDRFRQRYPSFDDQRYRDEERFYKEHFAGRLRELLSRERLGALIEQGNFEDAKTAIKQAMSGSVLTPTGFRQSNNLLNQWDRLPVLDAPAEPLVRRLYDLLYGGGDFDARFDAWVELLSAKKPGVWPAATYFLMLLDPENHIFVKPSPWQLLLGELGDKTAWPTRPNAAAYKRLQSLSRVLFTALAPLKPRDMIDVQSFIWRLSNLVGSETSRAWIFQTAPQDYDLPGALAELDELDWGVRQHAAEIKPGDVVYLWEAGEDAGILAMARVLSGPAPLAEDERELRFYRNPERFRDVGLWVRLQVERVLLRRISHAALHNDPALREMAIFRNPQGTTFALTQAEAETLARLIDVEDEQDNTGGGYLPPPDPLDGPAFVVIHSADRPPQQVLGQSYEYSNYAGGAHRQLTAAVHAWRDGGPPVYLVIYRPAPYYSFVGWARVTGVEEAPGTQTNEIRYRLTYAWHRFPLPVNARAMATSISWLSKGLAIAFRGFSIRPVPAEDVQLIARRAYGQIGEGMTIADAAFTILTRAGGGPLHLSDILNRIQDEGLAELRGQTPQLSLASIMLRDGRFLNLGKNTWVLAAADPDGNNDDPTPPAELPEPPTRQPAIYADEDARFWRIHFPRELWQSARRAGVIAIGWPFDAQNQSVKRFRQIRAGDRVVAYVQGGVVGGIGVVSQAFELENPRSGLPTETLGEEFNQYIRVAWADAPAEPVDLLDALRHRHYTDLYNRIKNPHTVIPLSRDDYTLLLSLLQVDDAGEPRAKSRLPNVWPQLAAYLSLARTLGDRNLDADQLQQAAQAIDPPPADSLDADDLVAELLQLRLIEASDATHYRARDYVGGDEAAMLRLCALALLVPLEGSADQYMLPAHTILPRLRSTAAEAQPVERFALELGEADSVTLAGWYAEAGLVDVDGDTWQPDANALEPLPGDDPATQYYNLFLRTLLADIAGELVTDLPHVEADAPLPPVEDLEGRLRELGQDLLFDSAVVRRVYRSLLAGRHVVLSGPPGTGKTELARLLPSLLWREAPQTFSRLTFSPDKPPVEQVEEQRDGYASVIVTATEDWGVRDVVGGIGPRLDGQSGALSYAIEHGALTRVVLQHYDDTEAGRRLPPATSGFSRRDFRQAGRRYRGAWLVIDEFTRAPIDAAFGSLLTTLSGNERARIAVPTASGEQREVPLPRDFRIIGTLNSFDRHFLNQISEAMKRRFDFIDVLPPPPAYAAFEQGIAAKEALRRIRSSRFDTIIETGNPPMYHWPGVLRAEPAEDTDGLRRYRWHAESPEAEAAMTSFWRLFSAIRVFRQLGTAQIVAVYMNLLTGVRVGMPWEEALDTALADALADQLQVLSRDEQRTIDAMIEHAGQPAEFAGAVRAIVRELPPGRRAGYFYALRERDVATNGQSDIAVREDASLSDTQIARVFAVDTPLAIPHLGVFRRRLRDLIGERGL